MSATTTIGQSRQAALPWSEGPKGNGRQRLRLDRAFERGGEASRAQHAEPVLGAMRARQPSVAFEVMRTTGILEATLPELMESVGCEQNRYHARLGFASDAYNAQGVSFRVASLEPSTELTARAPGKVRAVVPIATSERGFAVGAEGKGDTLTGWYPVSATPPLVVGWLTAPCRRRKARRRPRILFIAVARGAPRGCPPRIIRSR